MDAKHTPTPWRLGGCSGRMVRPDCFYGGDGFIADVDTTPNADFIVRAVNAHDEMLAALKKAQTFIEAHSGPTSPLENWGPDVRKTINDAIAKAESAP